MAHEAAIERHSKLLIGKIEGTARMLLRSEDGYRTSGISARDEPSEETVP